MQLADIAMGYKHVKQLNETTKRCPYKHLLCSFRVSLPFAMTPLLTIISFNNCDNHPPKDNQAGIARGVG